MTTRNFLEFVTHSQQNSQAKRRHLEALWQAAYRAGAEAMRERAAELSKKSLETGVPYGLDLPEAIRALPIDAD